MIKRIAVSLLTFLLIGLNTHAVTPGLLAKAMKDGKLQQWVDSVFSSMTFEEKIGQLFMVWVRAQFLNVNDDRVNAALRLATRDRAAWEANRKRVRFEKREELEAIVGAEGGKESEIETRSIFGRSRFFRSVPDFQILASEDLLAKDAVEPVDLLCLNCQDTRQMAA